MSSASTDQLSSQFASTLAFGFGDNGPFISAGISLLYGLFGSTPTSDLVKQVQDMLNTAVSDMESFYISQEIKSAGAHATGFYENIKIVTQDNDNTIPTLVNLVSSLSDQFGVANLQFSSDLATMASPDIINIGNFFDYSDDAALQVLLSCISARMAAEKAVILAAGQVFESRGANETEGGNASATVADDALSQQHAQYVVDAYANLRQIIYGVREPRSWVKLDGSCLNPGDVLLPYQYLCSPGNKYYLALTESGSCALYAGSDPNNCAGMIWISQPSAGKITDSYLIMESSGSLSVYTGSPGAGGSLIWSEIARSGYGTPSNMATVTDYGNLYLSSVQESGMPLWAAFSEPVSAGQIPPPAPPQMLLFDTIYPDINQFIFNWPRIVGQQDQYQKKLADPSFNPWMVDGQSSDINGFAQEYGWSMAIKQLLGFRKLTRILSLGPLVPFNTRSCQQVSVSGGFGGWSGWECTGGSGYAFTDTVDSTGSFSAQDGYPSDGTQAGQTPNALCQGDVQTAWNTQFNKISQALSDSTKWDQCYATISTWESSFVELGGYIPGNAPEAPSIDTWSAASADPGSVWNKAESVQYAISFQNTTSGRSLRSPFTMLTTVSGRSCPTISISGTIPDGTTSVEIWRAFTPIDGLQAPSFSVPTIVDSIAPTVASWTDTD